MFQFPPLVTATSSVHWQHGFSVCFILLSSSVSQDSISEMFPSVETEADIDSITSVT